MWINSVTFAPDGRTLASGYWDGNIRLWNVTNGDLLHIIESRSNGVFCVAFSPDSSRLASGTTENTICLWDVADGRLLQTLESQSNSVISVAFAPDGPRWPPDPTTA